MDFSDRVRFCGEDAYPAQEPYCGQCRIGELDEERPCPGEGTAGCHHGEVTEGVECARCEGTGKLPWCLNCGRWVDFTEWYDENYPRWSK